MNTIESQEIQNKENELSIETAIKVHNLSKIYKLYPDHKARMKEALHPTRKKYHKNFFALNKVSFEAKKGEVLGIIGKNGSGKSTLLKVISGLLAPSGGSVTVNGSVSALIELGAGFNPEFSGFENIYFYGSVLGFSKDEMDERIDDILDFADIGEFIHQPLRVYSSGMRARLAFAVATEINADILIIDEVLAVGDVIFQRKCYARIQNMFKDGKTVIFVSHQRNSIVTLCNDAILLDNGKLLLKDEASKVVKEYEKLCNKKYLAAASERSEIKLNSSAENDQEIQNKRRNDDELLFDHSLIDKDIIFYKKANISLRNFAVNNREGHKVNILKSGKTYVIKASFTFGEAVNDIIFALRIKNIQGLVMTWIGYPFDKKAFLSFNKNDQFNLELEFDCNLFEGTYSVDIGLQSYQKGEIFQHFSVNNLYLFQIRRDPKINGFGPVNLNFRCKTEN
jgi:ABC-type polysaccharide/polyol phosphate transport system ATPase subunit